MLLTRTDVRKPAQRELSSKLAKGADGALGFHHETCLDCDSK